METTVNKYYHHRNALHDQDSSSAFTCVTLNVMITWDEYFRFRFSDKDDTTVLVWTRAHGDCGPDIAGEEKTSRSETFSSFKDLKFFRYSKKMNEGILPKYIRKKCLRSDFPKDKFQI